MADAPDPTLPPHDLSGWRQPAGSVSLPEVHGSVPVPTGAGFWRKMMAFAGPGYLVAVGYMDPGNWATDLAGGARYGYTLLSVILISNVMAIVLQASLLVRHSPQSVADAFCATRLDGDGGAAYGSLPSGLDQKGIVERARVAADA